VFAIYDDDDNACGVGNYCAWGVDVLGNDFRCTITIPSGGLSEVGIYGGHAHDNILLNFYDSTHSHEYDLQAYGSLTNVTGRVSGGDGNDWIWGSRSTQSNYKDELHGDGDDDILCGRQGNDALHGGDGFDKVVGEDGDDTVNGDDNPTPDGAHDYMGDQVCGNSDDDTVLGGPGDGDQVQTLDDGTDTVGGGPGIDDACSTGGDGTCEDPGGASLDDVCGVTGA